MSFIKMMFDISLIFEGVKSAQTAISALTSIISADGSLEKAELKLKLSGVISSLAEAQVGLSTATLYIAELEKRLSSKENLDAIKVTSVDGIYVAHSDNGSDGPFCSRCWDIDACKVRIAPDRTGELGMGYCPQCKNRYPMWNADAIIQQGLIG